MGSRKITTEMLELYLDGMSPREISRLYGVTHSSVGERLKRSGCDSASRRLREITSAVEKNRLESLYAEERLAISKIAAAFGVRVEVIGKALKFYQIPPRPTLTPGGGGRGALRRLRLGDTAEVRRHDGNQLLRLDEAAREMKIKIAIADRADGFLRVTRISEDETRRQSEIAAIDRERLAELYTMEKLGFSRIGRIFGVDRELIRQAVVFYGIPIRFGNYPKNLTGALRRMKIGETTELTTAVKYPHHNFHSTAERIGIRISMRKIGEGLYRVKRIG